MYRLCHFNHISNRSANIHNRNNVCAVESEKETGKKMKEQKKEKKLRDRKEYEVGVRKKNKNKKLKFLKTFVLILECGIRAQLVEVTQMR